MSANPTDLLRALKTQLLADKKKAAVLGVLFLVLVVVAERLFVSSSPPAAASAATAGVMAAPPSPAVLDPVKPTVRPAAEVASPHPATPVANAPSAPKSAPAALKPAGMAASQNQGLAATSPQPAKSVIIDELPRVLTRDLFSTTAWSKFPAAGEKGSPDLGAAGASAEAPSPGNGVWQRFTSALDQVEAARQDELQRLDRDFAALQLQSTLTGPTPMAYISGRLLHEGDTISGFTVTHIGDRRVALRRFGLTRQLRMP
jgi:hypothetical protein